MSVKRLHRAKAKQRYERERTGETIEVQRRGRTISRRVSKADKSQPKPNYKCGKCGDEIALGTEYLFWLPYFRSSSKSIRCTKPACYPRPSERESSLMAEVLSAMEAAEDALESVTVGDVEALREALSDVQTACEEVASQYREAAEHFGGYGENADRADELEYVDLDWSPDTGEEDVSCDQHNEMIGEGACDDCVEALNTWWDETVESARAKLE